MATTLAHTTTITTTIRTITGTTVRTTTTTTVRTTIIIITTIATIKRVEAILYPTGSEKSQYLKISLTERMKDQS